MVICSQKQVAESWSLVPVQKSALTLLLALHVVYVGTAALPPPAAPVLLPVLVC